MDKYILMTQRRVMLPAFILLLFFLLKLFFMVNSSLLVEETYYWNYSTHLDFSFLDHPPMVAWLIKAGTLLFGTTEWGVRCVSIPCWLLTMFFSFKLTRLIKKEAAPYVLGLLSILPFFFVHSLIITPDIPLILCWSAALYYLYQALVLDKPTRWYVAGVWIGLGLLSKYTIVLLGPATLIFLLSTPSARKWFFKKEPYLCALIALLLFSPVIYWNATHEWASFHFQGTRRFKAHYSFSFHELAGLLFIFLTPAGILSGWLLFSRNYLNRHPLNSKAISFLQLFTLIPILFFSGFSFFHHIQINWIGPCLLALLPWLAIVMSHDHKMIGLGMQKAWIITTFFLLFCYSVLLVCVSTEKPRFLYAHVFSKLIPWDNVAMQVQTILQQLKIETHSTPLIIPLDSYKIGSELAFYQQKLFDQGKIPAVYKIIGAHVLGGESLMYRYWGSSEDTKNHYLLLIAKEAHRFNHAQIYENTSVLSPVLTLHPENNHQIRAKKLYYQLVKMN